MPSGSGKQAQLPLPALLSQTLVAFTIELDNEFERRMNRAGHPGVRLSLVIWSNLVRFIGQGGSTVQDLAANALAPRERIASQLGCLERWGVVTLNDQDNKRSGWGSGRGIRGDWMVRLTSRGAKAAEIWPPLAGEIETRWEARFGNAEMGRMKSLLQAIADQLDVELPQGLPHALEIAEAFPARARRQRPELAFPALLSQVLLAFKIEYERESGTSLALSANALRVLAEKPVPVSELPRRTGASPGTCGIGWQLKPFVLVEADPHKERGKLVRLSPRGLAVQRTYRRLIDEIPRRWEAGYGKEIIRGLTEALRDLFARRDGDQSTLSAGLLAPPDVARGGALAPSLGRRTIAPAARKRARDLVLQNQLFVKDPAGNLPHYPMWDMNRGFGP
jgi:hypothetical protein